MKKLHEIVNFSDVNLLCNVNAHCPCCDSAENFFCFPGHGSQGQATG